MFSFFCVFTFFTKKRKIHKKIAKPLKGVQKTDIFLRRSTPSPPISIYGDHYFFLDVLHTFVLPKVYETSKKNVAIPRNCYGGPRVERCKKMSVFCTPLRVLAIFLCILRFFVKKRKNTKKINTAKEYHFYFYFVRFVVRIWVFFFHRKSHFVKNLKFCALTQVFPTKIRQNFDT